MRVLVLDDDPSVRSLVRASLDDCEVVEAADGASALALLGEEPVDVALIDIGLPGIDGLETLRLLSADLAADPPAVLMLTGLVGEVERVAAHRLGADGYVTKPFDPDDLAKTVREVAGRTHEERRAVRLEELRRAELLQRLQRGFGE